jgi:hypothetical protein
MLWLILSAAHAGTGAPPVPPPAPALDRQASQLVWTSAGSPLWALDGREVLQLDVGGGTVKRFLTWASSWAEPPSRGRTMATWW